MYCYFLDTLIFIIQTTGGSRRLDYFFDILVIKTTSRTTTSTPITIQRPIPPPILPIHSAIRPTAHMIHYQAPFSYVAISLPSCNPDGRLIATDLLSFFPATASPRFGPRLGTSGRGQELLPTLVAAKVEGLSITFGVKSSCFVHGHPADGILGHGFRFFHGHAPFLVVLLQLSLRLQPVLLGISLLPTFLLIVRVGRLYSSALIPRFRREMCLYKIKMLH